MDLINKAQQLISGIQVGEMSSTAYDTSWFLRLRAEDGSLRFPSTYDWVVNNQHKDGSWGGTFETFHDRLVSTLAVVNALYKLDPYKNAHMIEQGLEYIRRNARNLKSDSYETIGFELLFTTLLDEAFTYGFQLPYNEFSYVKKTKEVKLSLIPENWMYQKETSICHNLEFLGGKINLEKAVTLVETNGSIGNSPSASAYVAQYSCHPQLHNYLNETMLDSKDGGISNVRPFEIFEFSWVYYNLLIAGLRFNEMERGIRHLKQSWRTNGVGISKNGLMPDADDSALAMNVLAFFGHDTGTDFLKSYQSESGYLCFPFERNPSVSTNIHILDAIRTQDSDQVNKMKGHIVDFLYSTRVENKYWKDKWHASPYYATSHAMLALVGVDQNLIDSAIAWMIETQRSDGSWGVFAGTLEETAYCIQALIITNAHQDPKVLSIIEKAVEYLLANNQNDSYPELWIGKGLYTPVKVVESTVISALALYEKEVKSSWPSLRTLN